MSDEPDTMAVMGANGFDAEVLMRRLVVNREQTAYVLGVPPATVDYLHRMRQLPGVRIGKRICWKPETIRAFVDALEPAE